MNNFALSLADGAEILDTGFYPLINLDNLQNNRVSSRITNFKGRDCLAVEMLPDMAEMGADAPNFAYLPELDLQDGVIELDLAGSIAAGAPAHARGFVGVGFRIDIQFKYEGIYLRPTNGRADDQLRRNHACQYFAYPDFPWDKLRSEEPSKYEAYVDLEPETWTHMRVELRGSKARLYVHNNPQPVLVVNDMKFGADRRGSVGLWIEIGTLAHYSNLSITRWKR